MGKRRVNSAGRNLLAVATKQQGRTNEAYFKLGFGDNWRKYFAKAMVIYERELS